MVITEGEFAFGGDMDTLMVPYNQIPFEFKRASNKWTGIVSYWFFRGLNPDTEFYAKGDIDPKKALRHISAIMRSFEPKHEHKEACCAYLLSQWFDDVKNYEKIGDKK